MLLDLLVFVLVDYCFNFKLYLESCHPILELRDQEGLTQPSGRPVNSFLGLKRGIMNLQVGRRLLVFSPFFVGP